VDEFGRVKIGTFLSSFSSAFFFFLFQDPPIWHSARSPSLFPIGCPKVKRRDFRCSLPLFLGAGVVCVFFFSFMVGFF